MRFFDGGELLIEESNRTRVKLSPDRWCGIDRLLLLQPYVKSVRPFIRGEYCEVNLNEFRDRLDAAMRKGTDKDKSLCDWVLETHKVPLTEKDRAWLTVTPKAVAPVIINRTGAGRPRSSCYHNWKFPWHRVWSKYRHNAMFIGSRAEHEMFCLTCGEVPYHETADLLEAAQVIAGSVLFIGNQSVCHAMAEGLKKRILLEVWESGPNCLHFRDGVTHGWDEKVILPEI